MLLEFLAAQINPQLLTSAIESGNFDLAGFRQVWESEAIPKDPITVSADADPTYKAAVKDALLNLAPADIEAVGKLLDLTPAGPLIEVTKEACNPLFDLADTMDLTEKDI